MHEIERDAVNVKNWSGCMEGKQAEFLVYKGQSFNHCSIHNSRSGSAGWVDAPLPWRINGSLHIPPGSP
ncbi:MAG: hypothetical protein JZU65_08640 [Chlorobium sp.]|nr:hypothetical protein [Chlorobium sp.]